MCVIGEEVDGGYVAQHEYTLELRGQILVISSLSVFFNKLDHVTCPSSVASR